MTDRTMDVARRTDPSGATVVTVAGDLDHHTQSHLAEALVATPFGPATPVVLDLSELDYCDSTGITVLIGAYQRAKRTGSSLVLAGASPDMLRLFQIVGIDQIFTIRPTVDEALASLRS